MLALGDGNVVHWDRSFILEDLPVLALGPDSPRDLYISAADYEPSSGANADSPLASLAQLVLSGAEVLDSPRAPLPNQQLQRVVVERHLQAEPPVLGALDLQQQQQQQQQLSELQASIRLPPLQLTGRQQEPGRQRSL
jgi:hypothetical protein